MQRVSSQQWVIDTVAFKVTKIFLCAVTITALFLSSALIAFARDAEINPSDFPIHFEIDCYFDDEHVFYGSSMTGYTLYPTSLSVNSNNLDLHCDTYYSMDMPGVDGSYLAYNRGNVSLTKFWGAEDPLGGSSEVYEQTKNFLEKDVLIKKITWWVVFGFSSAPTSNPLQSFTFLRPISQSGIDIYFDGRAISYDEIDAELSYVGEVPNYTRKQDTISGSYFSYRAAQYVIVFKEPLSYTSFDPNDYAVTTNIDFLSPEGSEGWQNLRALVGFDTIDVEYYEKEEYYNGIISSNKENIYDINNRLGSISNSLNVGKPEQAVIDSISGNIPSDDLLEFTNSYGVMNNITDSNLINFFTVCMLSSVGVAFIGYALHGKRG